MIQNGTAKENNIIEQNDDAVRVIKGVINFLQLFIPMTLAKRLAGIVLLAAGVP